MRFIVNYIRTLFCKHEFQIEDFCLTVIGEKDIVIRQGEKRFIFCPKCGYHANFWKCFD